MHGWYDRPISYLHALADTMLVSILCASGAAAAGGLAGRLARARGAAGVVVVVEGRLDGAAHEYDCLGAARPCSPPACAASRAAKKRSEGRGRPAASHPAARARARARGRVPVDTRDSRTRRRYDVVDEQSAMYCPF